ncbi:MAG: DUF2254 domain-containing protein [Gemmatimonadaceae bacterium]|jgi:uncharacterized membrane protein|nr:DUF2254 domain-containing protein [Gemmatimonadaceae bacterium]
MPISPGRRLRALRDRLLGTLWFVPALLVAGALALAAGMVELSARVDAEALARWPRLFGAEPDSSRSILSAVASGMITVAGLTFSLTMVAVTQASTQYTPRVLRSFMADRSNQVVLGVFVGIFAYCLVVLRTIRSDIEGTPFVPSLAVVLGIALAIVGIGVLIYFVHHIASTLQASSLIARVARETAAAIDSLFPETLGAEGSGDATEVTRIAAAVGRWHAVPARVTGYVQAVDESRLLALAVRAGHLVRMERGVGDFVIAGQPLASIAVDGPPTTTARGDRAVAPAAGASSLDAIAHRLVRAWTIGEFRTVEQDAAFGVRQLVDVALKALSPGINDSTTAASCIDYLGALLVRVADRRIESPLRTHPDDVGGREAGRAPGSGAAAMERAPVRVLARGPSFHGLLRLACDEIRRCAGGNVRVLDQLATMLAMVAEATERPDRRRAILEQLALLDEVARRTVQAPAEREALRHACAEAVAVASRPTLPRSA